LSMKLVCFRGVLAVFLVALNSFAFAVDPAVEAKLRASLEVEGAGMTIAKIESTEMPGMYEVQFEDGPLVIAYESGEFFLLGDMFKVVGQGFVNLSEIRRNGIRAAQLADVQRSDTIVFPAKGETKGTISVFTDTTCFYCRKLHQEVPELNDLGIEVRYLAYPRSGITGRDGKKTQSYLDMVSAWCADDRQGTLTALKADQAVDAKFCDPNPVAEQFALGQVIGIRGTPAIVLQTGEMIPGYKPANDIARALGITD
jgi:thiol:disulfide interchange protein DsbC